LKEKVSINGQMESNILANGKKIKCMDLASSFGLMEDNTKVNSTMI